MRLPTLLGTLAYPSSTGALSQALFSGLFALPETKRRSYFAFDFDDVMRVNNVRNAWKIHHPDNASMRSFYDSSLWESRKLEGADSLKRLIREGVEYTSAVCVLVGTDTWQSRWVKYEIARAVIDGRGLLAVHINSLNHHQRRHADLLGFNPLSLLAVGPTAPGVYHLFEYRYVITTQLPRSGVWQWLRYHDYTQAVSWPPYLTVPAIGMVMPLSYGAMEYDFVKGIGHSNLGTWIDRAAAQVGR